MRAPGVRRDGLELDHLCRSIRWLGGHQDEVEERLCARRRDPLTEVTLAFAIPPRSTATARAGSGWGRVDTRKEARNLRQLVVGAVLTDDGRPVSCEFWPGNHSDQRALWPVVDRARQRFGLHRV